MTTIAAPRHQRKPAPAAAVAPAPEQADPSAEVPAPVAGLPRYLAAVQRQCSGCAGAGDDERRRLGAVGSGALQADSGSLPAGGKAALRGHRAGAPADRSAGAAAGAGAAPAAQALSGQPAGDATTAAAIVGPVAAADAGPATDASAADAGGRLHSIAAGGVARAHPALLPQRRRIQAAFGRHDISDLRAEVGGPAAAAARALGARAYAYGRSIGFRDEPDLRLAAHEAAHAVQQRAGVQLEGGVGRAGDRYERHADAVAEAVVEGRSAEPLLDRVAPPADAAPAGAGPSVDHDRTSTSTSIGADPSTDRRSPARVGASPKRSAGTRMSRRDASSQSTTRNASSGPTTQPGGDAFAAAATQAASGSAPAFDPGTGALQFACDCGTCARCRSGQQDLPATPLPSLPQARPEQSAIDAQPQFQPALQLELDSLAERTFDTETPFFAPHARGAGGAAPPGAGKGGGTPAAPATAPGAGPGAAGPAGAPGAAGPGAAGPPAASGGAAAGGAAPGGAVPGGGAAAAGGAASGAAAGAADPVAQAAAAAGAAHCPEVADLPPPEEGDAAETPDACSETVPVDYRTAEQKAEAARREQAGEPAPDEPAPAAIEARGQARPPPGAATPPAPPPPPAPPEPAECRPPEAAPAPAPLAPPPVESPPPTLDARFDPAREQSIAEAHLRRGARIAEFDAALAQADEARGHVDAQAASSVHFAAAGAEPGADRLRAAAAEMTMRSFGDGLGEAQVLSRRLREEVPQRVGDALRRAKADVEAARLGETARVAGEFAAARAAARSQANASRAQIDLQFALAVLRALLATAGAAGRVATARDNAVGEVDGAETKGLSDLDAAVVQGQADLRQVGTDRGLDAMKTGRRRHDTFKGGRINERDSWSDGHLTDRRADARANAALTTAGGMRDSFAQQAENQAFQFGRAKSSKCSRIVSAAFATRSSLGTQADRFTALVRDALAPQIISANGVRTQLRSAVDAALQDQLAVLASRQKAQIQAVDDTAFLQQAALEEEAHGAATRLLASGARSLDDVAGAYAGIRGVLEGRAAPPAAVLAPALALAATRIGAALAGLREQLSSGLAVVESTLLERRDSGLVALADLADGAAKAAGASGASFAASMGRMRAQASTTFGAVADGYDAQLKALTDSATSAFGCAVAQLKASVAGVAADVKSEAAEQKASLEKSFQESLGTLGQEITDNACRAAEKEQPAWKEVVKIILIILIIVIAIALTGPLAAALAGGTATFLSTVAAGVIIGALSAAAMQVVNNWASGQSLGKGVLRAAVMGAIAGAFGGALGGFAGGASSLAGAVARQVAVDFAGSMVSQLATGLIFDHRLDLPHYSLEDLAMSVFMAALFVRRNPTAASPHGESYIGAGRTGAPGVRGAAWRGLAGAQGAAHGVAGVFMPGGRFGPRVAATAVEGRAPLPGEPRVAEPGAGPRLEPPGRAGEVPGGAGEAVPRAETAPAARPAGEAAPAAAAEPAAARPAETAAPRTAEVAPSAEPAGGPAAARESPLGPRPESVTEVGVGDHRVYARRAGDGTTEIGLCSGACGPLTGKIDDMLPHATEELRGRLAELRERTRGLQEGVDRGEVARGPELDARIDALTTELRGIAGEHPALRAMMDTPPLPGPATPRVPAGPNAHVTEAIPAHVVPPEPVANPHPGPNEASVRAALPEAQRVGFDRWASEIRARGGDIEAVLGRMPPERVQAAVESVAREHAAEVARGRQAEHMRARAGDNPLDPQLRVTERHGDVTVRYENAPPNAAEIAHAQRIAAATGEPVQLFGDTASGISYPGIDGTIGVPPRALQVKTGGPAADAGWPRTMAQRARASADAAGYSHVEVEISMPGKTVAEVRAGWDAPPQPGHDAHGPVYDGDILSRVTVRCSDGIFTPPREVVPGGTPPTGGVPPTGSGPTGAGPTGAAPSGAAPTSAAPTGAAGTAGTPPTPPTPTGAPAEGTVLPAGPQGTATAHGGTVPAGAAEAGPAAASGAGPGPGSTATGEAGLPAARPEPAPPAADVAAPTRPTPETAPPAADAAPAAPAAVETAPAAGSAAIEGATRAPETVSAAEVHAGGSSTAASESPLGARPESVTEVGIGDHRLYARRGADGGTEIGLCSGVCGPLKAKVDELLPHAPDELRGRLAELRRRARELEASVDRGEVARGPDLDTRIAALTAELRGIAGEHPALRTLLDVPVRQLELPGVEPPGTAEGSRTAAAGPDLVPMAEPAAGRAGEPRTGGSDESTAAPAAERRLSSGPGPATPATLQPSARPLPEGALDIAVHLPEGVAPAAPQETIPIGPGWQQAVIGARLGRRPVLYVLRDVVSGEILKVGLSEDIGSRLGPYQTATLPKYSGRRVAVDILPVEVPRTPSGARGLDAPEAVVRGRLEEIARAGGAQPRTLADGRTVLVDIEGRIVLPWDNTVRPSGESRLGYRGQGTPGAHLDPEQGWAWGVPEEGIAPRERLLAREGGGRIAERQPPLGPQLPPPAASELATWTHDWLNAQPQGAPQRLGDLARAIAARYRAHTGRTVSESLVQKWLRRADLSSPSSWRNLTEGE